MRYSLEAGGKRLRPILTLAVAEATGGNARWTDALPAACAVELVHTYSLIHDDLPAMDNDTLRRGRPTSHVVFGEGMAILAGDGLMTEAFALLAREPSRPDSALAERKLHAIALVAEAAGATGMVGGQAIDLAAAGQCLSPASPPGSAPSREASPHELSPEALRDMHARKTGALIRAACTVGAVMVGADARQIEAVARFGTELGLAFQIVDDILDVAGADSAFGKTAGKDAAAGKPTYPSIFGLERSRAMAQNALEGALAALSRAGISGQLPAIARWVVQRTH
jgi:geranylgeranyl pyrophosphate synthase